MDKNFFANPIGFRVKKALFSLLFLFPLLFLAACAASDVSRSAAEGVDETAARAKSLVSSVGQTDVADLYQNSPQRTKGAIYGGAIGAVAGGLTTGVGFMPGTAVGAILGASYGSYLDSKMTLEDVLENRGVSLIELGDQILIVIPSARLFEVMTSNLKAESYSTLRLIVLYINRYIKTLVRVTGYTDDSGSPTIDCALSQQQADQVARVLEKSGINARLLYASGLGGVHLVAPSNLAWDSDNYRIEITFEKLFA